MPLFNLAWYPSFFWDGRAKSLREQVLMPIQDAHEMNETLARAVAKLAAEGDFLLVEVGGRLALIGGLQREASSRRVVGRARDQVVAIGVHDRRQ